MDALPVDLLGRILGFLDTTHAKCAARVVCRTWHTLLPLTGLQVFADSHQPAKARAALSELVRLLCSTERRARLERLMVNTNGRLWSDDDGVQIDSVLAAVALLHHAPRLRHLVLDTSYPLAEVPALMAGSGTFPALELPELYVWAGFDLSPLAELPSLRTLRVATVESESGAVVLRPAGRMTQLQQLDLAPSQYDIDFAQLPNLQTLLMRDICMLDAHIDAFADHCPALHTLSLTYPEHDASAQELLPDTCPSFARSSLRRAVLDIGFADVPDMFHCAPHWKNCTCLFTITTFWRRCMISCPPSWPASPASPLSSCTSPICNWIPPTCSAPCCPLAAPCFC